MFLDIVANRVMQIQNLSGSPSIFVSPVTVGGHVYCSEGVKREFTVNPTRISVIGTVADYKYLNHFAQFASTPDSESLVDLRRYFAE